jgi:UDP-N-acetylmuramate--alanine ligase
LPEEDGVAILCFDNEHIRDMAPQIERTQITYAIEHDADYQAKNIVTIGQNTSFDVYYQEELCGQIVLNVPGKHNVLNALATVAAAREMGVEMEAIAEAFTLFNGAKRRFQTKAKTDGVWIVDDYAHHPTEINTTLTAARQTKPKRPVCVFQPHRFTRTYHLATEFGAAFDEADVLILTDIYSAGEAPIDGVDGELIVRKVKEHNGKDAVYIQDWQKIADYLETHKQEGDLIMTMGAGNIYEVGEDLAARLMNKA